MPEIELPFQPGDWVIDKHNVSQRGQFTGKARKAGPHVMVELRYPDGSVKQRPLRALEVVVAEGGDSLEKRLQSGVLGKARDLRRLITFEKLKGTLHEVVYSMEAAQIDFMPYQFKPVLKFINSPTERLIIADEVGLGKTIESALIWMELQARRQAKRLLIVCPKMLTVKWQAELRDKFLLDARIVDYRELGQEIKELKNRGPHHAFTLIASYSGLRPPKKDLRALDQPPEEDEDANSKTQLLRELRHWEYVHPPFDLVIFDEAHYMRNAGTSTFHLGESVSAHNDTGVLCVSATPVNNSNSDLHSLLRLIDRDFFETQGMFDELLEANRPAIRTMNALSRTPADFEELKRGVQGMARSPFINKSPLFKQFLLQLAALEGAPQQIGLLAKTQDTVEKLNLLGSYVNRTRRVQIKEERPVRRPKVIAVEYTPEEMELYSMILRLVRLRCSRDSEAFHVFRVLGLQLRAASCLPVIAEDLRQGRLESLGGDLAAMEELLANSVGSELFDALDGVADPDDSMEDVDLRELVAYDFEKNDTKYAALRNMLQSTKDRKLVIFAFYRGTLSYLRRRLTAEGIGVAIIHGGIDQDSRGRALDAFRDPHGPRVLLSSEVGSEGIDLQFCSTVVNYDLPWNPMRVEQRIGRIDRVGQKSSVLSIVNFKVKDTVEERLYDRLHEKLILSSTSLGDLEAIIGEKVQQLTIDILSQELTPEEESIRMERTERAIENKLVNIRSLEDSGESLVALSDYVQKKIREDHERGRYVQPEELEDYLHDFFDREFQGVEIGYDTPAEGCLTLRLTPEAQSTLERFIREDKSLSAAPLRQRQFSITFRREVRERLSGTARRSVHFANHLSPLVRWITQRNSDSAHTFYDTSALVLDMKDLPAGEYAYTVQRWMFRGLSPKDSMAFAVRPLAAGAALDADASERLMQRLLREGRDWDYENADRDALVRAHHDLETVLQGRFDEALASFTAENETTVQIRVQRAANHWDRLIQQSESAIRTMKRGRRKESLIRGRETRLRNERDNKARKLQELNRGVEIDFELETVAAGVFLVREPEG